MKLIYSNYNGMYRVAADDYQPDSTLIKVVTSLQPETYVEVPTEFIVPEAEAVHYTNTRLLEYENLNIDYEALKEEYHDVAELIVHTLDGFTREELVKNNLADLGIREEYNCEET